MRTFWILFPAAFSALVLAAHFLRRGAPLFMLGCLGLFVLLGVRRPWARRVLQAGLALGAIEWVWTLIGFAEQREARGEPWLRMALILGAVSAVSALAVALLESPSARRRFERA